MRKIMRARNRIIQRSLVLSALDSNADLNVKMLQVHYLSWDVLLDDMTP